LLRYAITAASPDLLRGAFSARPVGSGVHRPSQWCQRLAGIRLDPTSSWRSTTGAPDSRRGPRPAQLDAGDLRSQGAGGDSGLCRMSCRARATALAIFGLRE